LSKNKRKKFAELKTLSNVFENFSWDNPVVHDENGKVVSLKGNWGKDIFENDHPIVLELACGQGDYTRQMAELEPNKNFIGVDIKGNRIWSAARLAKKLPNVAFLRTNIEVLDHFFDKGECNEFWITFPDPFLKASKSKRRLTAPRFLEVYRRILLNDGIIHLKTDSTELYEFTKEVLAEEKVTIEKDFSNVYEDVREDKRLYLKTHYEKQHLMEGRIIKYLRFSPHSSSL